jgi:hypothetical protein
MALLGSCAFGVVMGWLAVLIHHPASAVSAKSIWRGVTLSLFGWVCASALAWFYVGLPGVFVTNLGMALGVFFALGMMKGAHHA